MIWPRHGRLSNCCSVSFRRAQRNLLNSRLQSKLFSCSHPRLWRKVRYIFTKSLILSTHVLFWFLFFVERTCLWGAYNMCFTLLQYSFNKPETRSPQDCDQLTENPIFFRQSNNQLDSSKNYSYYTLHYSMYQSPKPKKNNWFTSRTPMLRYSRSKRRRICSMLPPVLL